MPEALQSNMMDTHALSHCENSESQHAHLGSIFDMLTSTWPSCHQNDTVLDYLRSSRFPSSFRPLCLQSEALAGDNQAIRSSLGTNLEEAATQEEVISLMAVINDSPRTLEQFLSFFVKYCTIAAELSLIERYGDEQGSIDITIAIDHSRRLLLNALDMDRSGCRNRGNHDCLGQRIWGQAYVMDTKELWKLSTRHLIEQNVYRVHRQHSSSQITGDVPNASTSELTVQQQRSPTSSPTSIRHLRRNATVSPIVSSDGSPVSWGDNFPCLVSTPIVDEAAFSNRNVNDGREDSCTMDQDTSYFETASGLPSSNISTNVDEDDGHLPLLARGSDLDRRRKQNRLKSKRHWDRMVQQRLLLQEIVSSFCQIHEARPRHRSSSLGQVISTILMEETHGSSMDDEQMVASDSSESAVGGQKTTQRSKAALREQELRHVSQIRQISFELNKQDISPVWVLDVIFPLSLPGLAAKVSTESEEYLTILLNCRQEWSTLLAAEHRLHNSISKQDPHGERRPIAELVGRLTSIIGTLSASPPAEMISRAKSEGSLA